MLTSKRSLYGLFTSVLTVLLLGAIAAPSWAASSPASASLSASVPAGAHVPRSSAVPGSAVHRVLANTVFTPIRTSGRAAQASLPEIDCELLANDPLWWPAGSLGQANAVMEGNVSESCFFVESEAPTAVPAIVLSVYLSRQGIPTGAPKIAKFVQVPSADLSQFVNCVPGAWQTHAAVVITPPPGYVGNTTASAQSESVSIGAC